MLSSCCLCCVFVCVCLFVRMSQKAISKRRRVRPGSTSPPPETHHPPFLNTHHPDRHVVRSSTTTPSTTPIAGPPRPPPPSTTRLPFCSLRQGLFSPSSLPKSDPSSPPRRLLFQQRALPQGSFDAGGQSPAWFLGFGQRSASRSGLVRQGTCTCILL